MKESESPRKSGKSFPGSNTDAGGTRSWRHRLLGPMQALGLLLILVLFWAVFGGLPLILARRVQHASAIDSKPSIRHLLAGGWQSGTVRLGDVLTWDDSYLRLGSTRIEWSLGGYLYFAASDLKCGPWEFARCSRTELSQVEKRDSQCAFYGEGHPQGRIVFGGNWFTNAVRLDEGELLLLRQQDEPQVVYALKLKQQEGLRVAVDYLELR